MAYDDYGGMGFASMPDNAGTGGGFMDLLAQGGGDQSGLQLMINALRGDSSGDPENMDQKMPFGSLDYSKTQPQTEALTNPATAGDGQASVNASMAQPAPYNVPPPQNVGLSPLSQNIPQPNLAGGAAPDAALMAKLLGKQPMDDQNFNPLATLFGGPPPQQY